MRISDWSSDVCSSDLRANRVVKILVAFGTLIVLAMIVLGWLAVRALGQRAAARAEAEADRPIGSASCRERVCQYVSISVVDVSLKKKTQNTPTGTILTTYTPYAYNH